jgi:hypothetical protein
MWSSPAALEKVKLSACKLLKVSKSFFTHAVYHFRMISSFIEFWPSDVTAPVARGWPIPTASAATPVASRFLRDTVILVIVRSPFPFGWCSIVFFVECDYAFLAAVLTGKAD